ncbi:MAG: DUF167 domain-containing protein [archaeon]
MIINAKVIPNSKGFGICFDSDKDLFKIHLKSRPEEGKANLELVKELRKLCNCEVRILKGKTSKNKAIGLDCTADMLNSLKLNSNSLE